MSFVAFPPPPIVVSQIGSVKTVTHGLAIEPVGQLVSLPFHFNGLTWDADAPLEQGVIAESALRTTAFVTPDVTNRGSRGVIVWLNLTAAVAPHTLQFFIQGKCPYSGAYGILTNSPAAFSTPNVYGIELSPGASGTTGPHPGIVQRAAGGLPRTWRVVVLPAGAGSATYSLSYQGVR
jgi:hypothetical protein